MSNVIKLSIKEKLGYSLGDTASHFVWDLVGFWLLIFYTDIYGLSPAWAGIIMFVGSIWDAIMDPVVGVISDRTNSRWGKFRPYLLFGAVPYAILAVLAFSTPDFGADGKVVYALVTCLLLRTAYAFINLPYSSMAAVMTNDSFERASLNTYRFIAAYVGQFIVTGGALYLVNYFGALDGGEVNQAKGYQYTVALFAVLSLVFFLIAFLTTKERIPAPKQQDSSVLKDFKFLFMNKPWVVLVLVGIVSFIMFAMQNAAIAYFFKYYIADEEQAQIFNIVGTIALIVALPLSKPLAKRFGNKLVYMGSSLISGIFFILIFFGTDIPIADDLDIFIIGVLNSLVDVFNGCFSALGMEYQIGFFSPTSQQPVSFIYIFNVLAKMAYAPAVPLLWTMIADSADYGEWKLGRRTTGLCFSAAVLAQKLGWAIGAAGVSWILGISHFVANAAVQEDSAILGIRLLVSVIPGILYASCGFLLIGYNIDNDTIARMKADLDAKREAEQ